jgi:shikimate kinase
MLSHREIRPQLRTPSRQLLAKTATATHNLKMMDFTNIALIGMPGVGKSTLGVLLAKALSWGFVDTDVLIQVAEERPLKEIIHTEGIERFARIEQRHIVALDRRQHVIAVGSSAVCGPAAMQRLKSLGVIVHLDLPLFELEDRLTKSNGRGHCLAPGQTLESLFQQRQPLYQEHADITVHCLGSTHEELIEEVTSRLSSVGSAVASQRRI